ncbi:MAG: TonB-dependent receptor plug domain-containing protein, partial [Niabella sp.]
MQYLKYILVVFFVSISFFQPIFATEDKGVLTGYVLDKQTQMPLSGANIYIHEIKQWATTNTNGQYSFTTIPDGRFTIEVSHVGYKTYIGTILVKGNTTFNFELSETIVEGDNITVTGVASATDLRNVPSQVSVLSKTNLEQNTGTTLLDAVAKLPGVSIVTTGPAIAKPFIRGLGYNRVVTLNDGVRQEGQQWGDEHGIEVDEYSAKRIEVLRGPASLMYGSDAIGGVVNIITNTPVPDKTIRANYTGSYNSNNRLWGQFLDISGNNNGFNWNAYGSFKNAGDYKNKYDGGV